VSSEVDIRNIAVVQADFVYEIIFRVSGYTAGVVESDVDNFAGFSVEMVVRSAFLVEYEFDVVSFLVCVRNKGITF